MTAAFILKDLITGQYVCDRYMNLKIFKSVKEANVFISKRGLKTELFEAEVVVIK